MQTVYVLHNRWMKAWGIEIASEKQMRKLSAEQIGDNLAGESVPFSFQLKNGIDLRPAPLVYTPDLVAKALQILDQNDRYQHTQHVKQRIMLLTYSLNKLTWPEGIPQSEIWIKIGGDKGGKSFKMSFQLVNVPAPNSVQNTCVFCLFEAKDSPANLTVALERFRAQVTTLQQTQWR